MNIKEEQQNKFDEQYESLPYGKPKMETKRESFFKSFSLSFLLLFIIVCIFYWPSIKNTAVDFVRVLSGKSTARFEFNPFSAKRQNILVLGVDISEGKNNEFKSVRSDSISIVSIAPYARDVNIISVPRDSKVYLANDSSRPDKINHAFAKGGINLTVDTIEETFGIRIDNYIAISNKALITFIDEIGGLPIYVEKDMHYNDRTAGLYINLKKGEHILNGDEVEGYIRFRHDARGDIGRIARQQSFYKALENHIMSPKVITKLPEAIKASMKYIQTDMSLYKLTQLAALAKTIKSEQVRSVILPGMPSSRGSVSYWVLDPDKTQQIIDRLVYRDKPKPIDRAIDIGVIYADHNIEMADKVVKTLENLDFEVSVRERNDLVKNQISIHNLDVPLELIDDLKNDIEELSDYTINYDLVGFGKAGRDMTIIIGGNN